MNAALPSIRAVVLDARAARTALPRVPSSGERTAHVAVVPAFTRYAGSGVPTTFRAIDTREAVELARGTDVVVVIAGVDVSAIARDARILVACGVRAALIGVLAGTTDEQERNARHVLTGAGMSGDDAGTVRLDDENLDDAVSAAVTPRAADGFVAVLRATRQGTLFGRVIDGAFPSANAGSLYALVADDEGAGEARFVERAFTRFPVPSNRPPLGLELASAGIREGDEVVVAGAPISCAQVFPVDDSFGSIEPCIAFGGRGGWGHATMGSGALRIDRPICPVRGVDGRGAEKVGVILVKGAGLGPVRILDGAVLR